MNKICLGIVAAVLGLAAPAIACDQLTIVPQAVQCQQVAFQQVAAVQYAQIVQPAVAVTQLVVPQIQYVQAAVAVQPLVVQRVANVGCNAVAVRSLGCNSVNVVNVRREGLFANIRANIDARRAARVGLFGRRNTTVVRIRTRG